MPGERRIKPTTRRALLAVLALLPAGARPSAWAQAPSGKVARIGWLLPGTRAAQEPLVEEFQRGMVELGYIEGRTVATDYLYADGDLDRLPGLAAQLVAMKVDIIVTVSTP